MMGSRKTSSLSPNAEPPVARIRFDYQPVYSIYNTSNSVIITLDEIFIHV